MKRGERRHVHEVLTTSGALVFGQTVKIRIQVEVLRDSQILVQAETLWHVAYPVLDGLRVLAHIDTEHGQLTHVDLHRARHEAQKGGLSGAVGSDQGDERSEAHFERQVLERLYPL